MSSIITLTTDFGLLDAYVGTMKGVILSINPRVTIVDICHEVERHDIRGGMFLLSACYRYFPPGTIHVAVVDPGVGTARRGLALSAAGALFVGPDNGIFSFALAQADDGERIAIQLTNSSYWLPSPSATFHGRDIFAPVAAHLSLGVPIHELGTPLDTRELVRLSLPLVHRGKDGLVGEVVHVDRFGNLVTNITRADLAHLSMPVVEIGGKGTVGLRDTFGDGKAGELIALIGSTGYLEIAVCQGSAQQALAAGVATRVRVREGISRR